MVGEAPGRNEDAEAKSFVGQAGEILHRAYLGVLKLHDYADVYLSNSVRCRPVGNTDPTKGQVNSCRTHLFEDLRILQSLYEEILILCVGAPACQSVLDSTLGKAFGKQGEPQSWGWAGTEGLKPCRVWATYHPANLLNKRNPSRILVVKDHLETLGNYLKGTTATLEDCSPYELAPETPPYRIERLSVDVETYGAVASEPEQTSFHPVRMLVWDKPHRLVHTAAITWRDPDGNLRAAGFWMDNPLHVSRLAAFLRNSEGLVGQNLKFDLMMLRAASPLLKAVLQPYKKFLVELSVLNYQHSELRPERSLKAIALLLGITKYDEETSLSHFRYPDPHDVRLMDYNVKDAWATFRGVEILEERIRKDFPNSEKLSGFSRLWYSRLLWTCLLMEESGVAFDVEALDRLDFQLVLESALIYSECRHRWDILLQKKGSEKCIRDLFIRGIEEVGLVGDPRIELTKKKKVVSVNQKNASLLLELLPPASVTATQLRLQQKFESYQKLITSYTRPMLHGTVKNPVSSRLIAFSDGTSLAYPTWYPVPSTHDSGLDGGTLQGRITCKQPALQTLPKHTELGKRLAGCLTTRFNPGFLIGVDLSQIELRVAALLSGDPVMMEEYRNGVDRHTKQAKRIIRKLLEFYPDRSRFEIRKVWYERMELEGYLLEAPKVLKENTRFGVFRQMGKTTNFLILFRGGGFKLRSTFMDDIGVELPLEVCEEVIQETRQDCGTFNAWQDSLIDRAYRDGRIELPFTGASRFFIGSRKTIEDTYTAEICNFPVQYTAANIMLDIQTAVLEALGRRARRVHVGLNVYDALYADGPMSEYGATREILETCCTHSGYYRELCGRLEREVPLGYDITVLVAHSRGSLPVSPKGNPGGTNGAVSLREG